jgi:predicted DCC family thiol-disulfide oxidoreductase YuxK
MLSSTTVFISDGGVLNLELQTTVNVMPSESEWYSQGGELLVVFDGVCNFCNRWVMFVIRRDPFSKFRFATAQSSLGRRILERFDFDPTANLDTILVTDGVHAWTKSEAIFNVIADLSGPTRHLALLRGLPQSLRDWAYDQFGQRRYALFGRTQICPVVKDEVKARFLT